MKKVLFLFLIFGVGKYFGQTAVPPTPYNFNSSSTQGFTRTSSDWSMELGGSGSVPACTLTGSSGTYLYLGNNAAAASVVQSITSATTGTLAVNTNSYVNNYISWNALRSNSLSPAVTAQWSNDNGLNWNNISYVNTATLNNTWAAITPVLLPVAASSTIIVLRFSYVATGVGSGANYVGIDDIAVKGTPSPAYYYKGSGDLADTSRWGLNTDGSGAVPPNFTNNEQKFFIRNAPSATLVSNWTISGKNSVLNVGDGTNGNKTRLIIPSTLVLAVGDGSGTDSKLVVSNLSTLTVISPTFPVVQDVMLGSNSTVEFSQASPVDIWTDVTFNYANLILNGGGDKRQAGSNLNVNGTFSIAASTSYVMENVFSRNTNLNGPIICTGNITQAGSRLNILGSGSIGTINLNGTGGILNLTLNRANETLTLGGNLRVNNNASFINGGLALNNSSLTLSGDIIFPTSSSNGSITGSALSSLAITGSGSITNELLMDQTTPGTSNVVNLTLNRASTTLALGNNLVTSAAVFTNGSLDLNGKALNLKGDITFPSSAANGSLIGSTTSSLLISGTSGVISNSMFMSQASTGAKSLGLFSHQRPVGSLISLGNDLIVSGTSSISSGVVDLNGTMLTLSGPLFLPTGTAFNGFKGSLTSSLVIDGSSSINSGSLIMVQTNSASRSLNKLVLNRSSNTLEIRTPLESYGEIFVIAGNLSSNGNLFIRSDATNKGRIAPVTGTITGNIMVETFALGGTTGWTQLGASGVNGLTVASWEGQIPMTCISCPNGPLGAGGSYFVSIQGWDPLAIANSTAAYLPLSYSSNLNVGQGYWTYLGDGFTTTNDMTWTVTGTAVQGDQNVILSAATVTNPTFDGFNLISNPFPSPISWDAVVASNPIAAGNDWSTAIYNYNPDNGNTSTYQNGVTTPVSGGISSTIAMGQGFYVQAAVLSSIVSIKESNKIWSAAPLLRTSNDIGSIVRVSIQGSGDYDDVVIRFHSDATPSFDRKWDARKIFGAPGDISGQSRKRTSISTKSGSDDYSINSLPYAITEDAVIPVLVRVSATGQHTITGLELENMPNSCVILKDKLKNVEHNLKNGPYVINISDTESPTEPRFELRVCADITMSLNDNKTIVNEQISITQDINNVSVKFDFDKSTKATISVTNILGQKIMDNKSVTVAKDVVTLNIPEKQQLVFVTVTTADNKVTKKIVR